MNNSERGISRRHLLLGAAAGIAGAGLSQAAASPLEQQANPNRNPVEEFVWVNCLNPLLSLAVLGGVIYGGFWIMTGGIQRRRDNQPITRREFEEWKRKQGK